MNGYVLDTSVVIKWFSTAGESDLENALSLRSEIVAGRCTVIVPDLMLYELANALRYNPSFASQDVKDAVESVIALGFTVQGANQEMIGQAVEIAYEGGITIYDACFMALSEMTRQSLITADYKFYDRVKGRGLIVRLDEL